MVVPDESHPLKLEELQQPEAKLGPTRIPAKVEAVIERDALLTERSSILWRAAARQTDTVAVSAPLTSLTAGPIYLSYVTHCTVQFSLPFDLLCVL